MDRLAHLLGEDGVDPALSSEARQSGERIGDDRDVEVCLAPRAGAGMTGMAR